MVKLKLGFILACMFALFLQSGCKKADDNEVCLSREVVIVRYSYVLSPDTIIFDNALEAALPIDTNQGYIRNGYSLTIDTLIISNSNYKVCFGANDYAGEYSVNPYFYGHYCTKL